MSFPSSTPSYTGFTSTHTLQQDTHAAQHNQEQADITALANKIGLGASAPTSGTVLRGNGTGTTAYSQVQLSTDVSGVLGVSNGGTGGTASFLALVYPIGCIFTETTGVNPGTTFGFGTWTATGNGRVLIGNGTSDQTFTAGAMGGESNHALTINELAAHTHNDASATGSGAFGLMTSPSLPLTINVTGSSTGGGAGHNNLQPYLVVYFWKRVS